MPRQSEPSEYHPNEPKKSQRRDSQFSSSDEQHWEETHYRTGPVPHGVRNNQQNPRAQQFVGQYSTRQQCPSAAPPPYAHHTRLSSGVFHSQHTEYCSTAPQRHYSDEYTPPLSSPRRRESHSKSTYEKQKGCHASAPQKRHSNAQPPHPFNVHSTASHPETSYRHSEEYPPAVPLRRYKPRRSTENYTQYRGERESFPGSYDKYDERNDFGFDYPKHGPKEATEYDTQYTEEPESIPGSYEDYGGAEFERQKHRSRKSKDPERSKRPTRSSRAEEASDDFPPETKTTHPRNGLKDLGSKDEIPRPPMGKYREGSIFVKTAFDFIESVFSKKNNQKYLRINSEKLDDSQLKEFFATVYIGSHVREKKIDDSEEKDREKEAFEGVVSKSGMGLDLLNSLKEIATSERGQGFHIHVNFEPEAEAVRKILGESNLDGIYCCSLSVSSAYRYIEMYVNHKEADDDKKHFNDLGDWEKNQEEFLFVQFGRNYKQEGVYDARVWDKKALQKLPIRQPEQNPLILVREMLFGADVLEKDVGRGEYDFKAGCTTNFRDYLRSVGWYKG